ncbi:GNAT family protein [Actinopolymorpha sp. B11F2]|uniref:GNAT family N-acetyltransferase n=1 Tax=Actinopolymorpha sp. B11F2 TaxID=3160862 RepID=UPI0032E4DC46
MRHWPLFDLRLITPDLELRVPSLEDLAALADLAVDGVHDPADMPFIVPWTDAEPAIRARSTLQYHWNSWASWKPDAWTLELVVLRDGAVVGVQGLSARDFAVVREVHTGSWVGMRYHGQGIGTQMRAAVLHLGFAGLGAEDARSGAFVDNPASLAVSRKLGYAPDGVSRCARRGVRATEQRLHLTREGWERFQSGPAAVPVRIDGLEPCLPLFGLETATEPNT